MNLISLNGSSFVGQQVGYHVDWSQSVAAANYYYQPIDTFSVRFEQLLEQVKSLGFAAIDIWTVGQLNWAWATSEHHQLADSLLKQYQIQVTSLGGEFGETRAEFESACRLALSVGTSLLSGTLPLLFTDRDFVIQKLQEYQLKLAIENHPEKHPKEMLAKIGNSADGHIGTAIDTGWYATQGYDPAQAIFDLRDHLRHIHLKDVLAGKGHSNCGYGKGIVPIEDCLDALRAIGYTHDISVENHAIDHDPTQELRDGLAQLKSR
ncbi:MAG: sugar phosphate isomerase/epimerase family protein [Chloroflexota bacterium]